MKKHYYLLCLNKMYKINIGITENEAIDNLSCMVDSLKDLLQNYGIDDEEIMENLFEYTTCDMKDVEEIKEV